MYHKLHIQEYEEYAVYTVNQLEEEVDLEAKEIVLQEKVSKLDQ